MRNASRIWFGVFLILAGAEPVFAVPQATEIPTEMLMIRDPFKRPEDEIRKGAPGSDLERYQIAEFRMIGVSTGPKRMRAMVQTPDGKTFFVAEQMRIGQKNGFVRKITTEGIFVREKSINILGQEEYVDTEIPLLSESKSERSRGENKINVVPIAQPQPTSRQEASLPPMPGAGTGQLSTGQPAFSGQPPGMPSGGQTFYNPQATLPQTGNPGAGQLIPPKPTSPSK